MLRARACGSCQSVGDFRLGEAIARQQPEIENVALDALVGHVAARRSDDRRSYDSTHRRALRHLRSVRSLRAHALSAPARCRCCSSAAATRRQRSSRHGAAMTCTPIGSRAAAFDRHRADRQADARDRLREQAQAGPRRHALAVDLSHSVPIGGAAHGVAGAMITSTSGTARAPRSWYQRRTRCAAAPTPPAAARRRGSGRATAARSRRARAQLGQVERAAVLAVITNAAARARSACGKLDLVGALERCGRVLPARARASGASGRVEVAAGDGDAQAGRAFFERRHRAARRRASRTPGRCRRAPHRVVGQREVVDAAANGPRWSRLVHERERSRRGQAAERRLQAEHAAQRRRHADRAVGVGAERERHHAGGDRRAGAARRAAGDCASRSCGLRVGAVVRVLGREAVGVLVHVERADEHRAGALACARTSGGVARGRRTLRARSSRRRAWSGPATSNRFLTANGTPASGGRGSPASATAASIARGVARRARVAMTCGEGVDRRVDARRSRAKLASATADARRALHRAGTARGDRPAADLTATASPRPERRARARRPPCSVERRRRRRRRAPRCARSAQHAGRCVRGERQVAAPRARVDVRLRCVAIRRARPTRSAPHFALEDLEAALLGAR